MYQFPRLCLFGLITNGHLASGLQQAADVVVGRVIGQTTHRDAVALGQRQLQELRADHRILEEHLVEIPQPEHQEGILRELSLDPAVLRHHGGQCCFGSHRPEARKTALK